MVGVLSRQTGRVENGTLDVAKAKRDSGEKTSVKPLSEKYDDTAFQSGADTSKNPPIHSRVRLMLSYKRMVAVTFVALWGIAGCGERGSRRLPEGGFRVAFESHKIAPVIKKGETVSADVTVKNISSATWPSKPDEKNRYAVTLSYHWFNKNGEAVVYEGLRTPLPHDLKPDESVTLKATIQAPDKPGTYTLELTMVQELVAWFPERGGEKLALPVNVLEGTPSEDQKRASAEPAKKRRGKREKSVEPLRSQKVDEKLATKTENPAVASTRSKGPWFVQVGSFPEQKAAESLAKQLVVKGYDSYVVAAAAQGKARYRVRVGRLNNRAEAEALQRTLKDREKLSQTVIAKQ